VKLWDFSEPDTTKIKELHTLEDHTGTIWSVTFAGKSGILATGGEDAVRLRELPKPPLKK
jgi:WD40 repeat protein